jgi:aminoglycoside phosphotransferase (APT) family kinase protein
MTTVAKTNTGIIRRVIPGAPPQARWIRAEPRRVWPAPVFERIAGRVFPRRRLIGVERFDGGMRNANFKLLLDGGRAAVLRIYEHDASLCQKEVDLIRWVSRAAPVPEVIDAEPGGWEELPPFAVMSFVDGISFRDLKRVGDVGAIAQAASAVGETLAAIGRFTFDKPGWLAPGPLVGAPLLEGAHPLPRFVDQCLATAALGRRVPPELRARIQEWVWSRAPQLEAISANARLVHGDFNRRNLLMRVEDGRWRVAAVVDWEFAVSGSPLADLGSFLRYERPGRPLAEPHFSAAYRQSGGGLPEGWRSLARAIDMAGLCESLTHAELPPPVEAELVELVRATVACTAV